MGVIVKISRNNKAEDTLEALTKLAKKPTSTKNKRIAAFYGKLPGAFGDGLTYQKKARNEWQ